ncbi:Envelope glycoprotein gp160 [Thecaphora frezii]
MSDHLASASGTALEVLAKRMTLPVGMTPETINYHLSGYGYQPFLVAPIVFTIVFAILSAIHLYQNLCYRQAWMGIFTFGCILEMGGHALRIYGHFEPFGVNQYIAMQCILVITPAFFAAIDFTILGKLSQVFPPKYSILKPKYIIPMFVCLDVLSLGVQGGGSGVAAIAQIDGKDPNPGGNIVVVGLCVQLLGYTLFNVLLASFWWRIQRDPPKDEYLWNERTRNFLAAVFLSSGLIFLRSVYRTAEMAVGWIGAISESEWTFFAFDATLVALSVLVFVFWNPAAYIPANLQEAEAHMRQVEEGVAPTSHHHGPYAEKPMRSDPAHHSKLSGWAPSGASSVSYESKW